MSGYSLNGHGRMVGDPVRMAAYEAALRAAVKPGDVVVDVGTGTGVFALLAARLGARKVYGIEADDVVQVGREAARENGLADRVELIRALSTQATLPERADVVVMDVHGALPLFHGAIATIMDARDRLMKPGGTLIPARETLWGALAEAPGAHAEFTEPWASRPFGLAMEGALRRSLSSWGKARPGREGLLTEPRAWAELDYATITSPHAHGEWETPVVRDGTVHGISVWFRSDMGGGVEMRTGPDDPATVYGTGFFPLAEPIPVEAGDEAAVSLRADVAGDDYVWRWEVCITRAGQEVARASQSSFQGTAFSPDRLLRRSHLHRPAATDSARVDALALAAMDGTSTVGEIAERLRDTFPARFPRWEDAVTHVGRLVERHEG